VTSDLGDIGDGNNDAFDVLVAAIDASGQAAYTTETLELGSTLSDTAVAPVDQPTSTTNTTEGTFTNESAAVDTKYNYIPVLVENSDYRMESDFTYTYNSSVARQTSVQAAWSNSQYGPWSIGTSMLEEQDRSVTRTWNTVGLGHAYIWANYSFTLKQYEVCHGRICIEPWHWVPDHFQSTLTDRNPDPKCSGCKAYGFIGYNQPAYPQNPNYATALIPASPKLTRNTDRNQTNLWNADFAGFIGLGATASYGSITSVT